MEYDEIKRKQYEKLSEWYDEWDYKYKPSKDYFIGETLWITPEPEDFCERLMRTRSEAYYSRYQGQASNGFQRLKCLIYYAMRYYIATNFDKVIFSDNDFEWKLNNLV